MQSYQVSAVLFFQNDEEIIGTAVARLSENLRARDLRFELLAVEVDCRDNSTALLALLRGQHPELRITAAPARQSHLHAARVARGETLWFTTPAAAIAALDSIDPALERVISGQRDLVVISDDVAIARRTSIIEPLRRDHVRNSRKHSCQLPSQLVKRAQSCGLTVESHTRSSSQRTTRSRWLAPLLSFLAVERAL